MKKIISFLFIISVVCICVCCAKNDPIETKKETPIETKEETPIETQTPKETKTPVEPTSVIQTPEVVTYNVTYDLDGGTCEELIESAEAGTKIVLPTPSKDGFDFIGWYVEGNKGTYVSAITLNSDTKVIAEWVAKVVLPESIEVYCDATDGILYKDTVAKLTYKVLPEGASQEVTFKAMNKGKATVDEEGNITIVNSGDATFKVTSVIDEDVSASITVKVRPYINPYNFIDDLQVKSKDIVAQDIRVFSQTTWNWHLVGSVTYCLFEPLDIIEYIVAEGNENRDGTSSDYGCPFSCRYICVHDVGWVGTAYSNAVYCGQKTTDVSWHYTVGNDGIYHQLPDNEVGHHAGDGTDTPLEFYDSGIIAPNDEPAKITINQVTGKFMINGQDTLVDCPRNSYGGIPASSQMPTLGINNYVDTDKNSPTYMHYMIGRTWWSSGYGIVANLGGNLNSIGIESCINQGENFMYTWELLAKLIGSRLLPQNNLTVRDVKQHNTFSGKDCPQTMRTANRWETFLKYVEHEYILATQFYNFDIKFSSDSEYLSSNGMISKLPDQATDVTYKITFTNEKDNINIEKEYTVTLPAKSSIKNW